MVGVYYLHLFAGNATAGWLGTLQHRGVDFSFWLGNQGLEFTSMGRIWQYLLFVGLLFWAFLLTTFISVVQYQNRSRNRALMPYVTATTCTVAAFFLFLLSFVTPPFLGAIAWELLAAGRTASLDADVLPGLVRPDFRRPRKSPPTDSPAPH